mmetsp:Transcript_13595/g.41064  ORF Transcript_13595/g.41064 Transcript_13595/m.41064 type:complete len:268 (+) Transcript_13595:1475-2278(+)
MRRRQRRRSTEVAVEEDEIALFLGDGGDGGEAEDSRPVHRDTRVFRQGESLDGAAQVVRDGRGGVDAAATPAAAAKGPGADGAVVAAGDEFVVFSQSAGADFAGLPRRFQMSQSPERLARLARVPHERKAVGSPGGDDGPSRGDAPRQRRRVVEAEPPDPRAAARVSDGDAREAADEEHVISRREAPGGPRSHRAERRREAKGLGVVNAHAAVGPGRREPASIRYDVVGRVVGAFERPRRSERVFPAREPGRPASVQRQHVAARVAR